MKIDQIYKHNKNFYQAAMARYDHFAPYGTYYDKNKHKMDFFLNLGLLTLFKRWCKSNNNQILDDNINYSNALGVYHTDKFKTIEGSKVEGSEFYIKKGDMANSWDGIQIAFDIAISTWTKKVYFTTVDIVDIYLKSKNLKSPITFQQIKGMPYKSTADQAIKDARSWAREWFTGEDRFLIAGVFVNQQQRELAKQLDVQNKFNATAQWDHVTHYVVIPRASNIVRGTDFLASWGSKKSWDESNSGGESFFLPIKILKASIK